MLMGGACAKAYGWLVNRPVRTRLVLNRGVQIDRLCCCIDDRGSGNSERVDVPQDMPVSSLSYQASLSLACGALTDLVDYLFSAISRVVASICIALRSQSQVSRSRRTQVGRLFRGFDRSIGQYDFVPDRVPSFLAHRAPNLCVSHSRSPGQTSNVCSGSFASVPPYLRHVRFTPINDRRADIPDRQLRAKTRHSRLPHLCGLRYLSLPASRRCRNSVITTGRPMQSAWPSSGQHAEPIAWQRGLLASCRRDPVTEAQSLADVLSYGFCWASER